MEVRMEHTAGLGLEAEVWVDGRLLVVCDGVSKPGKRCPPGELIGVAFTYVTVEGPSWRQATGGNPGEKKQLDPLGGWSYTGYGQVVSVMPVVIDFGLLKMADPNWTTDEGLVGCYVKVPIDRLEICRAAAEDWPAGPA